MKPMTAEWIAKAEADFATMEREWETFREDLSYLSDFAVAFRYPGESADAESALDAKRRCRLFRNAVRNALGLET